MGNASATLSKQIPALKYPSPPSRPGLHKSENFDNLSKYQAFVHV